MTVTLKPLAEQVMVITGASSGIGLVTARMAARQGAKVLLVARSEAALADAVQGIVSSGGAADYFVADVADEAAVQAAAEHAVRRFGRIDCWVNNAGTAIYGRLETIGDADHRRLFEVNYFGAVHGCLAAIPHLHAAGGGALVTVASIASDMPSPLMGAYAATKHAVKAYVETLRMELAERDAPIAVTLVKPSGIDTPIGQHATNLAGGEAQIPPPVYAPELVADAILFCASHVRRDITVGGAGRAQALFAQHFPRLFEKLAPVAARAFIDKEKRQPKPANLFAADAPGTGQERSGEHAPKPFSLYTAAAKHPGATAVVGLGGLALAVGVLFANGRKRD
ncbi:Short-chain dehydrogenase [Sphingomonas gellani]|uniref:Short-chain dehydrogenase n=1 Tax=Sphingomonas gellani TaxID=1166340 RepID=A0A1H8BCI4_9SPHN|nr:SDR family oxidoreductase [Sphingomonas gellani]SEM80532.1 Short-chain dehydrogenase [Sphingomonas gellani]